MSRPETVFLDLDGVLFRHPGSLHQIGRGQALLPGTLEKLEQWHGRGCAIIITTGRPESMRPFTVSQLQAAGIHYSQLMMNIGGGTRVLVNDLKPDGMVTAIAHNLERNQGIGELELEEGVCNPVR